MAKPGALIGQQMGRHLCMNEFDLFAATEPACRWQNLLVTSHVRVSQHCLRRQLCFG